jgi:hypothetical protein
MSRIIPIDLHQKKFSTLYGLDQGEYYQTIEEFFLEVLGEYKIYRKKMGVNYLRPEWFKIKSFSGDLITINEGNAYLFPKKEEFFIQCRPESKGKESGPKLDRFHQDFIEKIGKSIVRGHSMGMDHRKKFILDRMQ